MVSHAVNLGLMDAIAVDQDDALQAGLIFARAEGSSRLRNQPTRLPALSLTPVPSPNPR